MKMRPNISCKLHPFSEIWDELLDLIVTKGEVVRKNDHTITFKILSEKKKFLKIFTYKKYNVYEIWIANKEIAYGYLWSFNGNTVPSDNRKSASEQTLFKLYDIERGNILDEDTFYQKPQIYRSS